MDKIIKELKDKVSRYDVPEGLDVIPPYMSLKTSKEELYKKYNSEESASKKDEIAIEMGKIITSEIVKHTDDRTGLIDKIQEQL